MKSICKSRSHSIIGLDHNLDLLKANYHKPTQSFLENVLSNQHVPCITRPTHITKSSATLIDNILVSRDIYNNTKCGIAISDLSDHIPCIMTWPNIIKNKNNHITFNVKKFDHKHVSALQDYLRHDWQILEMIEDANDAYQLFHSRLENSINKFTEEKTVKISYKKIVKQPWLTKGIIKANRKQTKLYKEWLINKDAITHDRYKHYRDALQKIKRRQKVEYYNSQCDRYKQNTKKLWNLINGVCGKLNDKSSSIAFITVNGIKHFDSKKISNEFASFFSNIGAQYSKKIPGSSHDVNTYLNKIKRNEKSIFLSPCNQPEIRQIILSLKIKKAVVMMAFQTYY